MSRVWPTAEESLREQFYSWELWGRGWATWDRPVHLEPPFRPFRGHYLPSRPAIDDGRHHTALSSLASWIKGDATNEQPSTALVVPEEHVGEPRYIDEAGELRSNLLHVPRDQVVRPDTMSALLLGLRGARYPLGFEIVGTQTGIALQISARESDDRLVVSALRNHFPAVTAVPDDHLLRWLAGNEEANLAVLEFGLRREFMLPLANARSFDPDLFLPFIAALEEMDEGELGAYQVLFEPAHSPWPESVFRAVTDGEGGDFFIDQPEIAKLGKQKIMQPLFAATVRLALGGYDSPRSHERMMRLATGLAQYETTAGNQFYHLQDDEISFDQRLDFFKRQSHRSGMLLGLDELVALVHLPSVSVQSKAVIGRDGLRSRAAPQIDSSGIFLGLNRHAGRETPVYLTRDRARRHIHVIGASGSGKSNLLLQILLEDIRHGGGVALLDPHGDLVDELLARIPEERIHDVILFDPADAGYPVGFNVLAAHSDLERTLLASDLVAIFRRLSTSWGDQMHAVLANAIQAFLESQRGGTIADLRRFLIDPKFRTEFLTTIPDPEIVYYWTKEFPLLHGRPQGPILTRLDAFLRPKLVRQMVTQRENRIDFRRVMDEGKIFLAKLAQGAIGEENAALLGSFLFAKFHETAMSRQDIRTSERRPFVVAADECQHFVTPSMASILSAARKYSMGLLLAHQDLVQLQRRDAEVYAALLANAGTRIVFRVSDADARLLAEGFADFTAEDLRALGTGEAICRFDRADHDFNLAVPLIEPINEDEAAARRERVIQASRAVYATCRVEPAASSTVDSTGHEATDDRPPVEETRSEPQQRTVPPTSKTPEPRIARKKELREEPTLGRGGAQHKYLQEFVKRFAEAQGYRATIEKPTETGGSVDVALECESGSIACEISVTSTATYETENVAKCLAAGYERVAVLAPERRRLDAIAKAVRATLPSPDCARVDFLLPEEFLTYLAIQTPPPASEQQVAGYRVRVSYKSTTDEETRARQRAVAEVVARSVKKLDE